MLVMTLQCAGTDAECFEGITRMAEESHDAVRATWSSIIADAEAAGWTRTAGGHRCPACAAAGESVCGVPIAQWTRALDLYCSGVRLRDWAGTDGLPTRVQFWNGITRRPDWRARIDAAGVVRRAGPVSADTWPKVFARIDAGEALNAICTGRDGWPSMRQWRDYAADHPDFRAKADAAIAARRPARAAVARSAKPPAARKRESTKAANQLIRIARRAEREAEAAAIADRRRRKAEAKAAEDARLVLIRDLAREAARRRKAEERERVKQEAAAAKLIERQRKAAERKAVAGDRQLVPPPAPRRPRIIRDGPRRAPRPAIVRMPKPRPEPRRADPAGVAEALRLAAERLDVSRRAIVAGPRVAELVEARHIWRYLVAVEMDAGADAAARAVAGDRSSVARSCAIIEDRREDDSEFDQWLIDASRAIAAAMGAENGEHAKPSNAIAGNATVAKGCDA